VLKDYHGFERNILMPVGVTWAFIGEKQTPSWTYYIPVLFALLGAVRTHGINKTSKRFYAYLLQLEESFSKTGWEHSFAGKTWLSEAQLSTGAYLLPQP
jgi:hypothetical protein